MSKSRFSRRNLFKKFFYLPLVSLGVTTIGAGCNDANKKDGTNNDNIDESRMKVNGGCDDLSKVSESEIKKRTSLNYVNQTPIPENHCSNCALYIEPKSEDECGGCMLFKGPVRPTGYCVQYQPRG